MKITNETKIGALASVSMLLLILGLNFLKGKDLFEHRKKIYAAFNNVEGLELANTVSIKALDVGSLYAIRAPDKSINGIMVTIPSTMAVDIPHHSVAIIS